jgi:HK97 gp10 family phage protein
MADYSKYQWKTQAGIVKHGGKVGGIFLDTELLDKMTDEIAEKASLLLNDVGNEVVSNVYRLAPEDTGELKDSYLRESGMTDNLTYTIRDGVPYGIFQELGTSKMAAQPHVVPAMEDAEAELVKAFTELFE